MAFPRPCSNDLGVKLGYTKPIRESRLYTFSPLPLPFCSLKVFCSYSIHSNYSEQLHKYLHKRHYSISILHTYSIPYNTKKTERDISNI